MRPADVRGIQQRDAESESATNGVAIARAVLHGVATQEQISRLDGSLAARVASMSHHSTVMRYLGNKTRLLAFIGSVLDDNGIRGGRAFDAFAGTASVGRFLKRRGFEVWSCDLMTYSFVLQQSGIELDVLPAFAALFEGDAALRASRGDPHCRRCTDMMLAAQHDLWSGTTDPYRPACEVLCYLEQALPRCAGFVTREYSRHASGGADSDRMYFTATNGQRIDAVRTRIHEWRSAGLLTDHEQALLLASLLEGADAVANTTGIYAAYVKAWQSNARRALRLELPDLVTGTGLACRAVLGDANQSIRDVGRHELLYLDPPYNTRQYSAYYHVPEVIATGWFHAEPEVRGKTGLIPDGDRKSRWSTRGGCVDALDELIGQADAAYVLMSYNSEGIIPETEIRRIFRDHGVASSFRIYEHHYARYRADRDHERRRYAANSVTEKIYFVRLRS
jgi:adenine-specific DNA-methyltransferase